MHAPAGGFVQEERAVADRYAHELARHLVDLYFRQDSAMSHCRAGGQEALSRWYNRRAEK
jgi:hypothetical protein